jgi:hypothetical protein
MKRDNRILRMTLTQTPEKMRPGARSHGPDRTELLSMLQDGLIPDVPAIETLLDRIERREVSR